MLCIQIPLQRRYKKKNHFRHKNLKNVDKEILFCTDCMKYPCKQRPVYTTMPLKNSVSSLACVWSLDHLYNLVLFCTEIIDINILEISLKLSYT